MPEKSKKKLKQKQKQKQSQQVIVNVTAPRARRRAKQPRQQQQPQFIQAPPVVQYLYRDNLALNLLNDKKKSTTQETTTATATSTATPTPSAAAPITTPPPPPPPSTTPQTRRQPIPQPSNPPPTGVARVLESNRIHKSTTVPQETTKRNVAFDFEKALNPKKRNDDNEPLSFRNLTSPVEDVATNQSTIPTAIRMTAKGLPYRRTREEKLAYNEYMENVVASKPANERTREEAKAYNEYINSLSKPFASDEQPSAPPQFNDDDETTTLSALIRPITRKPRKIQPVNFDAMEETDADNNDDEEMFFSPLKKKPT